MTTALVRNERSGWIGTCRCGPGGHKAAATPDLTAELHRLEAQLQRLGGALLGLATARGAHATAGEDRPLFAEPTNPRATQDDGIEGRPRGDEGIVQRRTLLDLERQIDVARKRWRGAAFADKEAAKAKLDALEREREQLLQTIREDRLRRNYGRDGLGGTSGMPVAPVQEFAEPTSPWSDQADSRPGDDRGDPKVVRRRKMEELAREIMDRKLAAKATATPAERVKLDRELGELSREYEKLLEEERRERDEQNRSHMGGDGTDRPGGEGVVTRQYAEPTPWHEAT